MNSLAMVVVLADHPDNFMFSFDKDLRTFAMRRRNTDNPTPTKKKDISPTTFTTSRRRRDEEVGLTNSEDNFGKAKDNILDTLDKVEKNVLRVAEHLIHDEVDILFGKDHGSAIKDSNDGDENAFFHHTNKPRKFSYRDVPSENNHFPNKKMTMDVKVANAPFENKILPHSLFLDFMESYAENCHAQFGY